MVCLDTTFLVDFLRGNPALKTFLDNWEEANETVGIPAPALTEVASGAALEQTGRERQLLDELCARFVVHPLTERSANRAGKIDADLTTAGETIGLIDAMIAAIAIENEEPLVTRNRRHFERVSGLSLKEY